MCNEICMMARKCSNIQSNSFSERSRSKKLYVVKKMKDLYDVVVRGGAGWCAVVWREVR